MQNLNRGVLVFYRKFTRIQKTLSLSKMMVEKKNTLPSHNSTFFITNNRILFSRIYTYIL